jgi:carbon-monoxide dehydrogenase medium subunit
MKPVPFDYRAPAHLAEACDLLTRHGDHAMLLAGGQSLMPLLAMRLARPKILVDLNTVRGLDTIAEDDGTVRVGALTRQRTACRSPVVRDRLPLLASAIGHIGHPQVRNRGTVGGSIAYGHPSGELPAVALALDATMLAFGGESSEIAARDPFPTRESAARNPFPTRESAARDLFPAREIAAHDLFPAREITARDFFPAPGATALRSGEILTEVRFPVQPPSSGHAIVEVTRRERDFAVAGAVAAVTIRPDGICSKTRVALLGLRAVPCRALHVEAALTDGPINPTRIASAARAVADDADPPNDVHASAAYRRSIAATLVERALTEAALLARGKGTDNDGHR